jgi:hypothetical protein
MSSVLITVDIEIKPYLRKYLIQKSVNKAFPLRFANASDYNILLIRLVTNYNTLSCIPIADKQNAIDYFKGSKQPEGQVTIILPFNQRKNILSYNYLSVRSKKTFRKEVRLDFNFEFSRFLFRGMKEGKLRINLINDFKNRYHITEDDLKTESLYRHSSRLLQEL